jgi:hypothetical protein
MAPTITSIGALERLVSRLPGRGFAYSVPEMWHQDSSAALQGNLLFETRRPHERTNYLALARPWRLARA